LQDAIVNLHEVDSGRQIKDVDARAEQRDIDQEYFALADRKAQLILWRYLLHYCALANQTSSSSGQTIADRAGGPDEITKSRGLEQRADFPINPLKALMTKN
jgi:hypothetical protein